MARIKRTKKKSKSSKRKRRERRFLPRQTHTSAPWAGVGMLGAGVLGAGVWAQWIAEQRLDFAQYLVAGGAVLLSVALWMGDKGSLPVRVGDAGVAVEKGSELVRVAWCDLERISLDGRTLMLQGADSTLTLPLGAHPQAVAWVLAEAARRVPDAMDVKGSVVDALPKPKDEDGELLVVEAVQVTGRSCAYSDEVISFERDARLCPRCGQVYHRDHVPNECVTCEEPLGGSAVTL